MLYIGINDKYQSILIKGELEDICRKKYEENK